MRSYSNAALTLALILSIGFNAVAAETPATNPAPLVQKTATQTEQERVRLSRAAFARRVRDMATWNFAVVTNRAWSSRWAIAEIVAPSAPTLMKVVEQAPGWEKVEGNRADNLPAGTEIEWVHEGVVTELKPLTAIEVLNTPFRLPAPKTVFPYRFVRADLSQSNGEYSPFYDGAVDSQKRSVVLCALPEATETAERIKDVWELNPPYSRRAYLIDEEAVQWVIPAQSFHAANRELFYAPDGKTFSPEKVADIQRRLEALLDDPNPFLFAAAVRTLAEKGELKSDFVANRLPKLDKFRQAVFVYSVLLYSPAEQGKTLVAEIQRVGGEAQNQEQIEAFAVGVECASRTHALPRAMTGFGIHNFAIKLWGTNPPSLKFARPLMQTLADKQQTFGGQTEMDGYIAGLLKRFDTVKIDG